MAEVLTQASLLTGTVRFIQGDVAETEFDKNSFTRIVSFCVLEHIPEWQRVLKKAHEWLAPGGYLVISVDSLATIEDEEVIKKHQKDFSVVTYFNSQTLESALMEAGFSSVELHPILKSNRAKEQFMRTVVSNRSGRLSTLRQLIEYASLRKAEKTASNRDKGIFLIAKARR